MIERKRMNEWMNFYWLIVSDKSNNQATQPYLAMLLSPLKQILHDKNRLNTNNKKQYELNEKITNINLIP